MDGSENLTRRPVVPAARGRGALLQRDYWAVVAASRLAPADVAELLAARFREFAPEELVRFRRADGTDAPLEVGDDLVVEIRGMGTFGVRVTHRDRQSLTLATLAGHPEAGRITFGAYRNPDGLVVLHIRSRARSSTRRRYLGFKTVGDPMQTSTWADFINRLAETAGAGVAGEIHAETRVVAEEPDDREVPGPPTFLARGD